MLLLPLTQKHAVVMPVYNEDTRRIMVGFEACIRELMESDNSSKFDFFMLSDTRDMEKADAELRAFSRLKKRLGAFSSQVFYRRREQNCTEKWATLKSFVNAGVQITSQ